MPTITEIIPEELFNIPWAKEAMERGQLFNVMVQKAKRLDDLELHLAQRVYRRISPWWKFWALEYEYKGESNNA